VENFWPGPKWKGKSLYCLVSKEQLENGERNGTEIKFSTSRILSQSSISEPWLVDNISICVIS